MDFTLSKQQQMVQKMYREFAENEVKPLAKKVDAEEYFPKETVEKMGKLGMMGIYFPTSVGGAGGDVLSYVMAVEELSKVCGTTGVIVSAHTSLCAAPIYENGTPEQKEKYLPKLCSGEWLGAFGLTEPGAGTDAQGQQTIAKEDGDYWVLNGSKIFITNAGYADVFIVIAVTDKVLDKKGRPTKLCSAFIVERTDPGFSVGKAEDKMGIRGSSTCELIFEDCRRIVCWACAARASSWQWLRWMAAVSASLLRLWALPRVLWRRPLLTSRSASSSAVLLLLSRTLSSSWLR